MSILPDDGNPAAPMNPDPRLALDQIQGNSIGGFLKDYQAFVFLRIVDPAKAAATLRGSATDSSVVADESILADVDASTSEQVLRFNAQFKQLKSQRVPEGHISATWTNIVFTPTGLRKLGKPLEALGSFPEAFVQGMKARADQLGDLDGSAPTNWEKIVDWEGIDVLLLIASDKPAEIDAGNSGGRLGAYLALIAAPDSGIELCAPKDAPPATATEGPGLIYGETREDDPGHEHFGFKDGISQPGIRGVDTPDDPVGNPHQGHPGQFLLPPGEFVIGYPRQQPVGLAGCEGPNPLPSTVLSGDGPITDPPDRLIDPHGSRQKLPAWAKNGSFLVFRRLEQDALGFRAFVQGQSADLGISEELFGAKLMGRFKSGSPLANRCFQGFRHIRTPVFDPGKFHPELGDSDTLNNNFKYGDDAGGEIVPRSAHIRKTFPRDQVQLDERNKPVTELGDRLDPHDVESRAQTHRLLRRGIVYGRSLFAAVGGTPADKRGLLFLAYQSDIERQFEFVQRKWILDPNFPAPDAGEDPIVTPRKSDVDKATMGMCPFHNPAVVAGAQPCPVREVGIQRFVTTRGGGYFFSPSIDALHDLLGGDRV